MKPSPFDWAKISKEVHSMSDVITAAYVNQALTENPDDDFGTADLSEKPKYTVIDGSATDHFLDALKYQVYGMYKKRMGYADKLFPIMSPEPKSCTCGAQKTYGPTCSKSFHSSWCDLNDRT